MSGVKCATLVALSVAVSEEAFPRQLGAESLIEKVCKDTGLDDLCSKSIRLPTGVTMSYKDACAHNVCTWPCGQKQCTNNCCPYTTKTCNNKCCCWGFLKCGCSKSKCGEWCVNTPHFTCNKDKCGETCVDIPCSGVSKEHCGETCVKVPDSLAINWKDASPCEHFSKLNPMLKTAEMACACLGALSDFLKHVGDFQSSEPSSVALNAASRMVGCLVKEGFHVQDDKAEVVRELTNGDDYIIQAAPVDLEKYVEMTTAVAACASTGACHLIHTALLDYFKPVATDVGNGVEDFLETFVLDSLLSPLAAAADVPLMLAEDLPQSLQCTADAAEAAFQDVKGKIEEVKDFFQDLKKKVETLQQGCQKAIEAVGGLADSLDTSVQNIVQNLLDGQVPLVDAVKQIKDLAEVKELLNALSQLKAEVADVKKRAEELDDLKMSLQDLAKSDDCGLKDVLEDLQDIPSLLSQVSDPLKKIQQLDINANSVQAGVVSYNQWVDFNLDLPCSKMELWTASLEGLSVSAHIPKFYACNFGYTLPLPNEHIPYLRIKKAAKALS